MIVLSAFSTIYKCPKCRRAVTGGLLMMSGNSFASDSYSDGFKITPMLPASPAIVKCKKCRRFFWLEKQKIRPTALVLPFFTDRAEFLSAHEHGEAIDAGMARNRDEEIYLRQNMWWMFNHRTRGGEKLFAGDGDKTLYESNCERLIALLQESERPDRKPLIAELHRNLGRFDKCAEVLETIDDKGHAGIAERLKQECLAKNSETVRLFSLSDA